MNDSLLFRRLGALAIAIALSPLLTGAGLTEASLACADARAHASTCCDEEIPGHCDEGRACDGDGPTINEGDAACLSDLSCDDMRAKGLCEKISAGFYEDACR